jgi:hypothetical protein
MASKKKQQSLEIAPVYRAIKNGNRGAAGQTAVTAAALQQLDRYAADIQRFLEESQTKSILDQLQAELNRALPGVRPALRICRD